MLVIRKIDWYAEIGILIIMVITIPVFIIYGFLIGLFILGIIQLLSAMLNTRSFLRNGFKKKIRNYWLFTILDLSTLFIGSNFINSDFFSGMIQFIVILGAATIAIYYMVIYKDLIDTIEIRNELAGFAKS